jgi:hypothetical protein
LDFWQLGAIEPGDWWGVGAIGLAGLALLNAGAWISIVALVGDRQKIDAVQ